MLSTDGVCPDGFEAIGNEWLGTVEGQDIDGNVTKSYDNGTTIIPASPPVWQYEMWDSCREKVCGMRSEYSYLNHTRVEMDKDT